MLLIPFYSFIFPAMSALTRRRDETVNFTGNARSSRQISMTASKSDGFSDSWSGQSERLKALNQPAQGSSGSG